jgi:transcriptional regulator with XRE-family HTH domain
MEYLEALGQTLREIRVDAGLKREDCSKALSREYLASVERGRQSISIAKFRSLCDCLGVTPSIVLFTVEARLASLSLGDYQVKQRSDLDEYLKTGRLRSEFSVDAIQGVRGKRAENNRNAIRKLQSEGFSKIEVSRKLGVGTTTVDRYWSKINTPPDAD